ncbi:MULTISPECIES: MarR family winged helix-turn-helix transcriptional regulator [unclassified Bordetella]|uniref:MarR family winged helix-turn-helix transcriptional regulator n=1 Tax=unclassified Bordetella TaxID=2630031 RepID=UPI001320C747|nr:MULTISPECIES: MarR family transcriptional regulator [unclassified Bordetella]MVW70778.1 MarR family transcriptional regulator [Bordetella sp. 15P40C-2]MVW80481.1 MarR family transcriptional regulator [Bordetella sp. 02P26C-1]
MTATRPPADPDTQTLYRATPRNISDDNVGFLIKQVYNSINRQLDAETAPLGLTAIQWRPIAQLARGLAATPAELARINGVDTGAMTRTLDRLETKGLLRRVRSHEDRRVVKIELTEAGLETAKGIPPCIARVLNRHLRGFSTDEVAQMRHLLGRMLANGSEGGPQDT